jgi:hypothetical protein
MANRSFQEKMLSLVPRLAVIEASCTIGSSGATSALRGNGVASITRVTTGVYKIVLDDPFHKLLVSSVEFRSGVTGAEVAIGAISANSTYQITTVGNSDWTAVGAPEAGVLGMVFVATGTGTGTGKAKALAQSGVAMSEIASQDADTRLRKEQHLILHCFDFAAALVDPASGSTMHLMLWTRDSSAKAKGE